MAEDPAALAAAAAEAGTAVVLDQAWAGNPILAESQAAVRTAIADALADAVLLDSVAWGAPGTDPEVLLTRHLGSGTGLRCRTDRPSGHPAQRQRLHRDRQPPGRGTGGPAGHHHVLAPRDGHRFRPDLVRTGGHHPPDASAGWPAEVRSVTAAGAATFPTIYESAHRHSWRRLRAAIDSGAPEADLERFAALTELVGQLHD